MPTIREQIVALLENDALGVRDLAVALGLKDREVVDHLQHVEKSVKARKRRIRITPAHCRQCGFSFVPRKRLSSPSRCPKCKHQRLDPPLFSIIRS